jgi:Cu2+-exporting ATPase
MCCPGCQAVATAIVTGGLETYYQFRTAPAVKGDEQGRPALNRFLAFDEPVLQQSFIHNADIKNTVQLHDIQLYVEGIHCAACCWLIEHALQKKAGVHSINVNLSTHTAWLCWDMQQHKLSELLQCIHDVGYKAQPYQLAATRQSLTRERRQQLLRLGIAGIGMMQAMMFAIALYHPGMDPDHKQFMQLFSLLVVLPVMFYSAVPFFINAWRNLRMFHAGMDLSVSLALSIAFVASVHAVIFRHGEVYFDSISMFVFLLLLARFAEHSARRRLLEIPQNLPSSFACQCLLDPTQPSRFDTVAIHAIEVGQLIRVKAGESIPLDGIVIEGSSHVNESAFSGEQKPLEKKTGDQVFAGTLNGDGVLTLRVTTTAGHTRLDIISRLAEWSLSQKPRVSVIADQLASIFTVLVLLLATAAALYWTAHDSAQTLAIVLSILVVSCPCALSLATPSALACCYQALRKKGLLVNSTNMMEQTRNVSHVIFDKTGTLTSGKFSLSGYVLLTSDTKNTIQSLLEISAALESYSEHPIATAFKSIPSDIILTDVKTYSGKGVEGVWNGECYRIGSWEFCAALAGKSFMGKTASVYLVKQNQWLAHFDLLDEVRPEAKQLVEKLQRSGKQVEILSGDSSAAVETLAAKLGISTCQSQMKPEQKLAYIHQLQMQGQHVLMVGDGINDIPVLAKADVSIAMNNASDLAKIKADAILLCDNLMPVLDLLQHSAKTRSVILQNIIWALLYNSLALPAAAMGLVAPWQAALGMSISSLGVTFNSLRLRKI